jgi:hypothetical protein
MYVATRRITTHVPVPAFGRPQRRERRLGGKQVLEQSSCPSIPASLTIPAVKSNWSRPLFPSIFKVAFSTSLSMLSKCFHNFIGLLNIQSPIERWIYGIYCMHRSLRAPPSKPAARPYWQSPKAKTPYKKQQAIPVSMAAQNVIAIAITISVLIIMLFTGGVIVIKQLHKQRNQERLRDAETGEAFELEERTRLPAVHHHRSGYSMQAAAPPSYTASPTVRGYDPHTAGAEPPPSALPPSPIQRTSSAPPIIPPLQPSSPLYGPMEEVLFNGPPPPPVLSPVSAERKRRRDIFRSLPFPAPGKGIAIFRGSPTCRC